MTEKEKREQKRKKRIEMKSFVEHMENANKGLIDALIEDTLSQYWRPWTSLPQRSKSLKQEEDEH